MASTVGRSQPPRASRGRHFRAGAEKVQQGDPMLAPARRVPQGFADFGRGTEGVVDVHQVPEAWFVAGGDRFDADVAQLHDPASLRVGLRKFYPTGRGMFSIESNLLNRHDFSERTD